MLRGQFLLLADPLIMPFETFGQQNYEPQEYKPPRGKRIPNLEKGTKVTFRVKLDSIGNEFSISFLHNRIESSKPGDLIGAEILKVNLRPKTNDILLQTFYKGKLIEDGNITLNQYNIILKAKKAYEIYIVTGSKQCNITLNGISIWDQHRNFVPIWATNFVRVDGNITLLGKPEGERPKMDQFKFTNFTINLKSLLDYNG
uniref:Galectin n=1 Tax=Globodera pallida TaxID=36090 RepID=A0A183C194_GLOPA